MQIFFIFPDFTYNSLHEINKKRAIIWAMEKVHCVFFLAWSVCRRNMHTRKKMN